MWLALVSIVAGYAESVPATSLPTSSADTGTLQASGSEGISMTSLWYLVGSLPPAIVMVLAQAYLARGRAMAQTLTNSDLGGRPW